MYLLPLSSGNHQPVCPTFQPPRINYRPAVLPISPSRHYAAKSKAVVVSSEAQSDSDEASSKGVSGPLGPSHPQPATLDLWVHSGMRVWPAFPMTLSHSLGISWERTQRQSAFYIGIHHACHCLSIIRDCEWGLDPVIHSDIIRSLWSRFCYPLSSLANNSLPEACMLKTAKPSGWHIFVACC